jgi:hypothetical protein
MMKDEGGVIKDEVGRMKAEGEPRLGKGKEMKEERGMGTAMTHALVIASAAKQSQLGLPRRFAPRNDGGNGDTGRRIGI